MYICISYSKAVDSSSLAFIVLYKAAWLVCLVCCFCFVFLLPKSDTQKRERKTVMLMHESEFSQIKHFGHLVLIFFSFLFFFLLFILEKHCRSSCLLGAVSRTQGPVLAVQALPLS